MLTRHQSIGPRPDLAKLPVNWPISYIGPLLFPVAPVMESSGTFGYRGVVADAAPETNRTATSNLGVTLVTNSTATFTCARKEKRYAIPEWEAKNMGGIEKADPVGAAASKRSVMRAHEDAAAAKVFTTARKNGAVELTAGKEFAYIGMAASSIRRVKGKVALVCSQGWLTAFLGLNGVLTRLQAVGGLQAIMGAVASAQARDRDTLAAILRVALGMPIDMVLVGDDDHWQISGAVDTAALVMVPDLTGMDAIAASKMDPIYGVSTWYMPDPAGAGDALFQIDTEWLSEPKLNAYDATGFYDLVELNSTGATCIKLPSATVVTTTTTTTTTTGG